MVMESSNAHFSRRFSDMMHVKAQQRKARLRSYVMEKTFGPGEDWAYDGLGPVEAREKTSRFAKSQPDDIEHWRRKIAKREFVITLYVDQSDVESKLFDPQSDYADQSLAELEKTYDEVCVQAMHATVHTGQEFLTPVTSTADGVITVDATSGFTYEKTVEINKNYMDAEVGNDAPVNISVGFTGDEFEDLMSETEVTSGDYNRSYPIEGGKLLRFNGIDFVPYGANVNDPVIPVSGGVRSSFALASRGLIVGMARQYQVTVKDRPDLVNVTQVQATSVVGATRTEGKLVQKVNSTD